MAFQATIQMTRRVGPYSPALDVVPQEITE